jgi:hypothetical protein
LCEISYYFFNGTVSLGFLRRSKTPNAAIDTTARNMITLSTMPGPPSFLLDATIGLDEGSTVGINDAGTDDSVGLGDGEVLVFASGFAVTLIVGFGEGVEVEEADGDGDTVGELVGVAVGLTVGVAEEVGVAVARGLAEGSAVCECAGTATTSNKNNAHNERIALFTMGL